MWKSILFFIRTKYESMTSAQRTNGQTVGKPIHLPYASLFLPKKMLIFTLGLILHLFLIGNSAYAQINDSLSIEAVMLSVMEKNPDLRYRKEQVSITQQNIFLQNAKFNSFWSAGINQSAYRTPNTIDERMGYFGYIPSPYYRNNTLSYSLSAEKLLPTGMRISGSMNWANYGKDGLYEDLKAEGLPAFRTSRSSLFLSFSQPLLLGRGSKYQKAPIHIAEKEYKASQNQYSYETSSYIMRSMLSYVNYVYAYQNLLIQKDVERAYAKLIHDLERLIELDAMPGADILYIRASAANQISNRISAENDLYFTKNNLMALMGMQAGKDSLPLPHYKYPIDSLNVSMITEEYIQKSAEEALSLRADYMSIVQRSEAASQLLEYSKASRKADLSVFGSVGYNGIYEANGVSQLVGPFYSNLPGVSYSVGVRLSLNPAFDRTDAVIKIADGQLKQAKAQVTSFENNIYADVQSYLKQLRYKQEVLTQARLSVLYNTKALKNENTKLKLGSSTVINLIQIQSTYVRSLNSLNSALRDLNEAIILYKFFAAELLTPDKNGGFMIDWDQLFLLKN